jgi:hypothetical protein
MSWIVHETDSNSELLVGQTPAITEMGLLELPVVKVRIFVSLSRHQDSAIEPSYGRPERQISWNT